MPVKVARSPQLLDKIVATIGELPTSPAVVSTVMGLTADLNTEVNKLSRVLSGDPALTAKVLRLSNSPFYGRARAVGSLNEAVLILGFYTIRSLVVASSTYSLFGRKTKGEASSILWDHSLATAMAARIVGRRIRHKQVEEAFIIGLLHDIGKLILYQKMEDVYKEIIKVARRDKRNFLAIEEEELGFSHSELGAIILTRWNFPEFFVEAVANHHAPDKTDPVDGDNVALSQVVYFANEMAKKMGYGFIKEYEVNLAALPQAEMMGLDAEAIERIQEELETHYSEEKSLFEE
jgi:putative nucleotidyltransferase with HDIG domain